MNPETESGERRTRPVDHLVEDLAEHGDGNQAGKGAQAVQDGVTGATGSHARPRVHISTRSADPLSVTTRRGSVIDHRSENIVCKRR